MDNVIYIVFSATPTGMGKVIRGATRNQYNHVSLSFQEDIGKMYSFARYYRRIPLYGGFVEESILRYSSFQGGARVKICRLPVTADQLNYLRGYIARLEWEGERYLYNTPEAVLSLLHQSFPLPKAHTCVSFVAGILERYHLAGAEETPCHTIRQLEELLEDYVIYAGGLPAPDQGGRWGNDAFQRETTIRYGVYTTARHFGRLAKRALLGEV